MTHNSEKGRNYEHGFKKMNVKDHTPLSTILEEKIPV